MKRQESRPTSTRSSQIWIGLAILLAIAIVLGLKLLGTGTDSQTTKMDDSGGVNETPTNVPTSLVSSSGESTPTTGPVDVPDVPTQDPFPADPVSQLAWIQRHDKPAMVLFHSTTCIPCKKMEVLVAKIRDDYEPDVYFIDVITNDKANSALVRQAGIQAIPTTFFINGEGKGKKAVGAIAEDALRAQLDLLRDGGL